MNKIFIIVVIIVVFVISGVVVINSYSNQVDLFPEAVKSVFSPIKNGDMEAAYNATAEGFRRVTSFDAFDNFLLNTYLRNAISATWDRGEVSITKWNTGRITGIINTSDGHQIPVVITMIKESGVWKVFAIDIAK